MMGKKAQWRVTELGDVVVDMDRPRELRLTHKAMKTFVSLTGCKLEDMEDAIQDPVKLEALYYAMLQADAADHGEVLKVEDMERLMDSVNPGALLGAAGKAIEIAYADAAPDKPDEAAEDNANPTEAAGAGATA